MTKEEKALLIDTYDEIFGAGWGADFAKGVDSIVKMHGGRFVTFKKVVVDHNLYVRYGIQYGVTPMEADEEAENMDKPKEFMRNNISEFDYEWKLTGLKHHTPWLVKDEQSDRLAFIEFGDEYTVRADYGDRAERMTEDDLKAWRMAYDEARARFVKKCKGWLKRYGEDRIYVRTVWMDE